MLQIRNTILLVTAWMHLIVLLIDETSEEVNRNGSTVRGEVRFASTLLSASCHVQVAENGNEKQRLVSITWRGHSN